MTEAEAKECDADESLYWFEKAGLTKLGQQEDGPCQYKGPILPAVVCHAYALLGESVLQTTLQPAHGHVEWHD